MEFPPIPGDSRPFSVWDELNRGAKESGRSKVRLVDFSVFGWGVVVVFPVVASNDASSGAPSNEVTSASGRFGDVDVAECSSNATSLTISSKCSLMTLNDDLKKLDADRLFNREGISGAEFSSSKVVEVMSSGLNKMDSAGR